MTQLYSLLIKARQFWDEEHSPYICDCITQVEDDMYDKPDHGYPITSPLLDFIAQDIEGKYSVNELLFGHKYQLLLSDKQLKQVREYREGLWQRLFDEFAS